MLSLFSRVQSSKAKARKRPTTRRATIERLEERTVLSAGLVTTSLTAYGDRALAAFLDGNQNLLVAGDANNGQDFAVLRYAPNGTLDSSFGQGGAAITPVSRGADTALTTVPYLDGRILVAGWGTWAVKGVGQTDFALTRYLPNGSLDPGFGSGGIVHTDIVMGQNDFIGSVIVQDDGYILAAGRTVLPTAKGSEYVMAHYTPSGVLDSGFASGGILKTGISTNGYEPSATLHDGKILLVGGTYEAADSDDSDLVLAQYNLPDGSVDTTFGYGGKLISDLGSVPSSDGYPYKYEHAHAVAVDSSHRIIVAGDIGGPLPGGIGRQDFFVARYNGDGKSDDNTGLDPAFGTGGLVVTDAYPYDLSVVNAVAIQPDDGNGEKIVVAGYAGYARFAVARYNDDGSLDPTFGQALLGGDGVRDGIVATPILNYARARSVAIQNDGKIVAAGYAYDGRNVIALARYLPNGDLDPDFGPMPSVSIGDVSLSEGNTGTTTAFNFTVTLSSVSGADVTVQYATTNGTATAPSDYLGTSGTLTIPAGALSATITVPVIGDTVKEANETFSVNLSSPVGATIADGQGLGTIVNDDVKTKTSSVASASLAEAATSTVTQSDSVAVEAAATDQPTAIADASQPVDVAVPIAGSDKPRQQPRPRTSDPLAVDGVFQDLEADLLADQLAAALIL